MTVSNNQVNVSVLTEMHPEFFLIEGRRCSVRVGNVKQNA